MRYLSTAFRSQTIQFQMHANSSDLQSGKMSVTLRNTFITLPNVVIENPSNVNGTLFAKTMYRCCVMIHRAFICTRVRISVAERTKHDERAVLESASSHRSKRRNNLQKGSGTRLYTKKLAIYSSTLVREVRF